MKNGKEEKGGKHGTGKIGIAVGSKRKETKPVREEKLGPAFSSAAYDVILLPVQALSSTVFKNLKFKYHQSAEGWLKTGLPLSAVLLMCRREPTVC